MKSIYTIVLFSFIVFSSCTKDENLFIPDQEQQISQTYLHTILSISQSSVLISIVNDKPNFISSSGKFLIYIPANSLRDELNKPFKGQIKLQFNKLGNDKSDFIVTPSQLFDGQTSSSDTYTFKITTKAGAPVILTQPLEVYLGLQKSTNLSRVSLYKLKVNKLWELQAQNLTIQNFEVPFDETTYNIAGVKTTISTSEQTFSLTQITNTSPNQSMLTVQMDSKFTATNTLAYFRSYDGSIVIQLNSIYKGSFISPSFTAIQNLDGQIITISNIGNENYFLGIKPLKISAGNAEVNIEMQNLTIQEIKAAIQAL